MLDLLVQTFGFKDKMDYVHSLTHIKLLALTIPIAGISAFVETYFGMRLVTIIAFLVLMTLELVSGLFASVLLKKKIESKKLSRFGFKVATWMILFFVINSIRLQFKEDGPLIATVFDWIFNVILSYVALEYLVSVLENYAVITGKPQSKIIMALQKKLDQLFNIK